MAVYEHPSRDFAFKSTPAVHTSRSRQKFVSCPVCLFDNSQYLFHKSGVRFVLCRTCTMVYTNPASDRAVNYFKVEDHGQFASSTELERASKDFETVLTQITNEYERSEGTPLTNAVLAGRWQDGFEKSMLARKIGLRIAKADDSQFEALSTESDIEWLVPYLGGCQLLILNELFEACTEPGQILQKLAQLEHIRWIVVIYGNVASKPARLLRHHWPPFFAEKLSFFNTNNILALLAGQNFHPVTNFAYKAQLTTEYILRRLAPRSRAAALASRTPLAKIPVSMRTGVSVALFKRTVSPPAAKLSIIMPCYNEERYIASVIEAVLSKDLKIPKELIIVESNSKDRTREIVQRFADHPEVRIILQEHPRGKGHAVREGLAHATGSIVLIQDADFEYDIDDYDALLEPILLNRTAFVLGSRTLGIEDWKVRRFEGSALNKTILNFGQTVFAATFNLLYQQRVTDVNTMFKVFRIDCLRGLDLVCDGFDFDIELACKLVKAGYSPMEVPVNYVARGFAEGKKINMLTDSTTSYRAFYHFRFKD